MTFFRMMQFYRKNSLLEVRVKFSTSTIKIQKQNTTHYNIKNIIGIKKSYLRNKEKKNYFEIERNHHKFQLKLADR